MTTGQVHPNLTTQRVLGLQDLKDNFLDFLREAVRSNNQNIYDEDGTFGGTKLALAADGADKFRVNGSQRATDGLGNVFDPAASTHMTGLQFQNALGVNYWIALTKAERPKGIQVNPRTGRPEYVNLQEEIGWGATPGTVTDNGNGTITLVVDSATEAGVSCAGRKVLVWMLTPAGNATTEGVAIEELTVAWNGTNNVVTTAGTLGQTTISTTSGSYGACLLGPRVLRNTDPRPVAGHGVLGYVTGAGAGVAPSAFSTADQFLFSATLANINHIARKDSHGFLKIVVQADPSDVNEPQIQVKNAGGSTVFSIDETGTMTFALAMNPTADLNGQTIGTPSLRWTSIYSASLSLTGTAGVNTPTLQFRDDGGDADQRLFKVEATTASLSVSQATDAGVGTYIWRWIHGGGVSTPEVWFDCNLKPQTDDAYDIGRSGLTLQRIRNAHLNAVHTEDTAVASGTLGRRWRMKNVAGRLDFAADNFNGTATTSLVRFDAVNNWIALALSTIPGAPGVTLGTSASKWAQVWSTRLELGSDANTSIRFTNGSGVGDSQKWRWKFSGSNMQLALYDDAETTSAVVAQYNRSGTTTLSSIAQDASLFPLTDAAHDIGDVAGGKRWRSVYARASVELENAAPFVGLRDTAATTDEQLWRVHSDGGSLKARIYTDDGTLINKHALSLVPFAGQPFQLRVAGHLYPQDYDDGSISGAGTYDIGQSAIAGRWRNLFLVGDANVGGNVYCGDVHGGTLYGSMFTGGGTGGTGYGSLNVAPGTSHLGVAEIGTSSSGTNVKMTCELQLNTHPLLANGNIAMDTGYHISGAASRGLHITTRTSGNQPLTLNMVNSVNDAQVLHLITNGGGASSNTFKPDGGEAAGIKSGAFKVTIDDTASSGGAVHVGWIRVYSNYN